MLGKRWVALLTFGMATSASADIFTVGAGAACTHATPQEAINAGLANGNGLDVINVARNRTYSAQAIVAQNDTLVIQGGFADCSSTTADVNNPTVLSGAGGSAAPVLRIQGNGNVTLRNLVLRDGDASSTADGGGLSIIDGPHLVTLNNVTLNNNQAGRGAGLSVNPGGLNAITVTMQGNSRVFGNSAASDGGGIFCRNASMSVATESIIINGNVSARDGGGIFAEDCSIDLASGHLLGVLWSNQAARNGGGVFATGAFSSTRIYSLFEDALTRLSANRADGGGGALYATNGADVQIQNVEFISNSALDGGAIQMRGVGSSAGNDLDIAASGLIAGAIHCPVGRICNRFVDNQSSVAGAIAEGPAAISYKLESSATGRALIRNVSFESNQGGRIVGGNFQNNAAGNALEVANAVLFGNQAIGPVSALISGHKLIVRFCSIGGNTIVGPSLVHGFTGTTTLDYVAAWQPGKLLASTAGGSIIGNYLMANDLSGIPPTVNNLTADPLFVSAGDLHLRADSPAIDYATSTTALAAPFDRDAEQNPRPIDSSGIANEFGPIDVGAYESPASELFADGFEN